MLRLAVFLCVLLAVLAPPLYAQDAPYCQLSTSNAPRDAPKFTDYPVSVWHGKPVAVRSRTSVSRMYRTVMREAQKEGPDFAGHYKIAIWGCGAPCTDWAVIDAKTGYITDYKAYRDVSHMYVEDEPLDYRPDSRLLIIKGAPHENEARDGLTYLLWTGKGFRQLAFYAKREYCLPFTDMTSLGQPR